MGFGVFVRGAWWLLRGDVVRGFWGFEKELFRFGLCSRVSGVLEEV